MSDNEANDDLDRKFRRAEYRLSAVIEWVPRIDNRLATLLGINTALTATLLITAPKIGEWSGWSIAFVGVSGALILVSYVNLYLASFPRTTGPDDSLTYFQAIQNLSMDDYFSKTESETSEAYVRDLVNQIHRNSEIVSSKFSNLKLAFRFTVATVIPWMLALVLLSIDG